MKLTSARINCQGMIFKCLIQSWRSNFERCCVSLKGVEFHWKVLSFIDVHCNQILQDMNGVGDGALALIGLKIWNFVKSWRENTRTSRIWPLAMDKRNTTSLGGRSTSTYIVTAVICSTGTFKKNLSDTTRKNEHATQNWMFGNVWKMNFLFN